MFTRARQNDDGGGRRRCYAIKFFIFKAPTQQLQKPVTESAQKKKN
jgi:hypothetical protein